MLYGLEARKGSALVQIQPREATEKVISLEAGMSSDDQKSEFYIISIR